MDVSSDILFTFLPRASLSGVEQYLYDQKKKGSDKSFWHPKISLVS